MGDKIEFRLHRHIKDLLLSSFYLTNFFQKSIVDPNIRFHTKDMDADYMARSTLQSVGKWRAYACDNRYLEARVGEQKATFWEERLVQADEAFGTVPRILMNFRENYLDLFRNITIRPH